jgi:predicted small lipoprotein YifL
MRRICLSITGALLAFALAGCGEAPDEGPKQFKGSDSPAIQEALKQTSENMKNKTITSKGDDKKPAAKDADKKPSGDGADKKK